ncbi:UNVERIFIED_CONTAM: hypothetical protein HDU68_010081 [Siphonaria sp. JEL0065]|nr:hypothetical protein HDU68_010081 [Siphonaria sp. JEL0065]
MLPREFIAAFIAGPAVQFPATTTIGSNTSIENNNDSETAKKLQQQQAFQLIVNGKVNAKVVSGKRCYQFPVLSPKCGRPLSQQYIEGQGGFTKYAGGLNPWGLEVKGVIERANYLYS